jgi:hypothetical protein
VGVWGDSKTHRRSKGFNGHYDRYFDGFILLKINPSAPKRFDLEQFLKISTIHHL